jgi:N-acetylmuramoyl-L-alanine amidase
VIDLIDVLPNNPDAKPWRERVVSRIAWLVLHHAASLEDTTPAALNAFHHKRGWYRLSYHYLISADGTVYKINRDRDITWTVAHGNSGALSVCLVGNRSLLVTPPPQWRAAVELFRRLQQAYPAAVIYGHKECPTTPAQATQCPGNLVPMDAFRADVREGGV